MGLRRTPLPDRPSIRALASSSNQTLERARRQLRRPAATPATFVSALHEWVNTPKCDVGQVAYGADVAFGPIDAHRNLRGPYTAAGTLLRALSDDAHARAPDLVFAHLLALLVVAPELRKRVPVPADVNRWLSIPREGNWPVWTRRIAHGLADFLLAYSERLYPSGVVAAFKNLDAADFTDQEFISVLLRRADPRILRLRVHTTTDRVDAVLASALNAYTTRSPPPSSDPECSVPEAWRAWFATRGVPTATQPNCGATCRSMLS